MLEALRLLEFTVGATIALASLRVPVNYCQSARQNDPVMMPTVGETYVAMSLFSFGLSLILNVFHVI